ncbi:ABC transporter permease, partial [Enterococcus faecalis]
ENKVTLKNRKQVTATKDLLFTVEGNTLTPSTTFEDNSENLEKAVFLTFVTSTEYQRITGKEGPEKDELLVFPETWTHQALP